MDDEHKQRVVDFHYLYQHYANQSNDELLMFIQLLVIDRKLHPKSLTDKSILFLEKGPFSDDEFAELIRNTGIISSMDSCLFNANDSAEIIIGGHNANWGSIVSAIKKALDSGLEVRYYSQELFLLEFFHGFDLFDDEERFLYHACDLDENLKRLYIESDERYEVYFDWKTWSMTGEGGGLMPYLPAQSPLSAIGYTASAAGKLTTSVRRTFLRNCLEMSLASLPQCESKHYMDQWGEGNSCKRLIRIARQVAYCPPNTGTATEQRKQSDLDYLKSNFYHNLCSSGSFWPTLSKFIN